MSNAFEELNASSILDCYQLCFQSSFCSHFEFEQSTSKCLLKDGLVEKSDAVINMSSTNYCGIKYPREITTYSPEQTTINVELSTTPTGTFTWNEFSWDQNCFFGDLSWNLNVSNYLECYETCLKTPNCSIFYYNSTQTTCFFHDSDQNQIFPESVSDNQQFCGYTCKLKMFLL